MSRNLRSFFNNMSIKIANLTLCVSEKNTLESIASINFIFSSGVKTKKKKNKKNEKEELKE